VGKRIGKIMQIEGKMKIELTKAFDTNILKKKGYF
jgi:hypothetical protein